MFIWTDFETIVDKAAWKEAGEARFWSFEVYRFPEPWNYTLAAIVLRNYTQVTKKQQLFQSFNDSCHFTSLRFW